MNYLEKMIKLITFRKGNKEEKIFIFNMPK